VLERTGHGRAERDHAATAAARGVDRVDRGLRQVVGLVERQPRVERGVAGR